MKKIYLNADQLLLDSFELASRIIESGFRPDLLVAIWRGGTPVGIAVQELFAYAGIDHDHLSIRTRHYAGIDERLDAVRVDGLEPVLDRLCADSRVLLVDDVFDTGLSVNQVIADIGRAIPGSGPEVRVATLYFKPEHNRTERTPDYFLHTTKDWLVFPHELVGLGAGEIQANKPGLAPLLARLAK